MILSQFRHTSRAFRDPSVFINLVYHGSPEVSVTRSHPWYTFGAERRGPFHDPRLNKCMRLLVIPHRGTRTMQESVCPLKEAVMVAVPTPTGVTLPVLSTVATLVLELVQVIPDETPDTFS